MRETLFIDVARQEGYRSEAAEDTLEMVRTRLQEARYQTHRFYLYRTGDPAVPERDKTPAPQTTRPRVLVAFQSADSALVFAQTHGLGRSPRLVALTLSQMLAALMQRPGISMLLIASEDQEALRASALPLGMRIERAELIERLTSLAS
ncbi:hypothetical protein [Candidatus Chloroploca asiatica]|uniref:Uncharacterized protein n=1 Tax=Candidatus Chloroploca asiatica TaxID=1506545 RepID=A0A2H3KI00_9CHLR|nr:hypothetical protein [Candidatus Chloroploca asiatica]PDV97434.1 hypothetical protein A9Q02_18465 [Candidatus Chloroploca asiatica]